MDYSLILSNCTASGIYYITARARSCSSNHISASKEIKTKVDIEDFTFSTPKRRKLTRSFPLVEIVPVLLLTACCSTLN
jgi:hypothetical protein